jgi:hypothetical protein
MCCGDMPYAWPTDCNSSLSKDGQMFAAQEQDRFCLCRAGNGSNSCLSQLHNPQSSRIGNAVLCLTQRLLLLLLLLLFCG